MNYELVKGNFMHNVIETQYRLDIFGGIFEILHCNIVYKKISSGLFVGVFLKFQILLGYIFLKI